MDDFEVFDGPPSASQIDVVNLTSAPAAVFNSAELGGRLAVLQPGEAGRLSWTSGRSLIVRDARTMCVIVDFEDMRGGQTVYLDDSDLRRPRWRSVVGVTFRNSTTHDVVIESIDNDGVGTAVASCPAGHYVRVSGDDGMWRVKTAADGLLLVTYLAGEHEQVCEITNTLVGFENDTLLTVTLSRIEADGSERPIATLPPMQHCLQANYAAWQWILRDAASGTELRRIGRQRSARTNRLGGHDLRSRRGGEPVNLVLRDLAGYPVDVFELDEFGGRQFRGTLSSDQSDPPARFDTTAGRCWAIAFPGTHRDLFHYVTTAAADQTVDVIVRSFGGGPPTVVEIVNTTTLTVDVVAIDEHAGAELRSTLAPGGVAQIDTTVSAAWAVLDQVSSVTLTAFVARREQPVTRIATASLRSIATSTKVDLQLENTTPCHLDVLRVGTDGKRGLVTTVGPGVSFDIESFPGEVWQFNQSGTHHDLANFIVGNQPGHRFGPRLAAGARVIATQIEFTNRTPLTLEISWFDPTGAEVPTATLKPGERFVADTFVGDPWIVRDDYSSAVLDVIVGKKRRQRAAITSRFLRPVIGQPLVDVALFNDTGLDVQYRLVDISGDDVLVSMLAPGQRVAAQVMARQPLRFVSPAFESEVGVFVPNSTVGQSYGIVGSAVRTTEPAGGELATGEVALYEHEGYEGRVWILNAGATDFRFIPGLNDAASSVRVGPSTGVTLFADIDHERDPLYVFMDLPKLPAPLGPGTASSLQIWTIDTPGDVGVSSRSILTEEYRLAPPESATGKPEPISVYRTIITVPVAVQAMDVWATEEVEITVEGQAYTIDPTRAARLIPNHLSRVVITTPAKGLETPGLLIRTNMMGRTEKLPAFPDAQVHQKVAVLPAGAMHRDRAQLGLRDDLTEQNLTDVQSAISNIARTVQYAPTVTANGIHYNRSFTPAKMEHPHWALDLSGPAPTYEPLSRDQVIARTAGARRFEPPAAQDFLGIGHFFSSATSIVVHTTVNVADDVADTTKKVAGDVVDTADNLGRHLVDTADGVGRDLVHGNIGRGFVDVGNGMVSVGSDVTTGVEHVGGDVVHGAIKVGGDVASGAGQLVVVTLQFAEEAVQFVLDHTGFVGELLESVFDKIGAELGKVVAWLLAPIGWDDVLTCHDGLLDSVNHGFDALSGWIAAGRRGADALFASLEDDFSSTIDNLLRDAGVPPVQPQDAMGDSHSEAMDKIEWLLSMLSDHTSTSDSPMAVLGSLGGGGDSDGGPVGQFIAGVREAFGNDNAKLNAALAEAEGYLNEFFRDPSPDPALLLGLALEIVKAIGVAILELANAVVDTVLDLIAGLLGSLKAALNAPLNITFVSAFYSGLTDGRELTVLSVSCLLIAIPATIFSKAIDGQPLQGFALPAAAELKALDAPRRNWGIIYGATQIVLSVAAPISEAQSAAGRADAPAGSGKASFGSDGWGAFSGSLTFVLGFVAQLAGCPIGYPDFIPGVAPKPGEVGYDEHEDFSPSLKDNALTLDDYYSHVAWYYGWATVSLGGIMQAVSQGLGFHATKVRRAVKPQTRWPQWNPEGTASVEDANESNRVTRANAVDKADRAESSSIGFDDIVAALTTVFGLGSMTLMCLLDRAYRGKQDHYTTYPPGVDDIDGRAFMEWVNEGGIWREGFGNVIGTFPDIAAIGSAPTLAKISEEWSVAATAAVEFIGHLAEGITYLVRVKRREIL
jgi:VHL beta domain